MTIEQLLKRGSIVREASREQEINELFKIVERDLRDSSAKDISYDWQFGIAYNAALKLATILVRSHGYRVRANGFHLITIKLIPILLGESYRDLSLHLEACRQQRNEVEYEMIGGATQEMVIKLREIVEEFYPVIVAKCLPFD